MDDALRPSQSSPVGTRHLPSVAALLRAVGDALSARFQASAVRGELSGFSRAASGHCYFTLKDADGEAAVLKCAMFRRAASLSGFVPTDGQLVELRGRLCVYEPRGELQFVVESMQRAGAGALFEQFLRIKARLEAEGLFDPARKRVLPSHPRAVGVVTSLAGAVLHDVATTLARRSPHVAVVVYPSAVQGAGAPAALCAAVAVAAARREVDVLILCRGGGSLEDLWAFNDEHVARAIAASPIPVITAIGHETDVTLADFVADVRAPTPTAAAELVAASAQSALQRLDGLQLRLERLLLARLDAAAQRLDRLAERLARPGKGIRRQNERLVHLQLRLGSGLRRGLDERGARGDRLAVDLQRAFVSQTRRHVERLAQSDARLRVLDPRQVLSRGFAWLADAAAKPVMSVQQLAVGEPLIAVLADGTASVRVEGTDDARR